MYEPYEEQHKIFTHVVTKEPLEVIIQTTSYKVIGSIHVRPDYRLTDEINTDEPFLAVTDGKVWDDSGSLVYETRFIAVGREQIVWIIPNQEIISTENN